MTNPTFRSRLKPIQHDAAQSLLGDKVLMAAIALSAVAALWLGTQVVQPTSAWIACGVLMVIAVGVYAIARATRFSRMALATVQTAFVVLHIQLAHGRTEYHFGVFVTLALLLVYLDWRPIVLSAVLFAVHHVAFNEMQAAGYGLYCLTEPNLGIIVIHAVYVIIQTVLEVVLAVRMGNTAREGAELGEIVAAVDRPDGIALDRSHGSRALAPMARALENTLGRMHAAVASVRGAAHDIDAASIQIVQGSHDLSERSQRQAVALQEASVSVTQFGDTVKQNAHNAQQANALAQQASDVATRGGQAVSQVVDTMRQIDASSQKISDITGVIDTIAFQTNILALNAAVEAARAGEQGRGFAVVASEVRALAGRSASAAKEIKQLITASVERVQQGTMLVDQAGATMDEIVAGIKRVTDLMGEISAATSAQSSRVDQVSESVASIDQSTQENARFVQQMVAAASQLSGQAQALMQSVAVFQLGEKTLGDGHRRAQDDPPLLAYNT